jgi:hypothetical protein
VVVDGFTIKLEVVAEGRIMLDPPRFLDFLPVPCLSAVDCWAEKLLANAVHGVSPMENRWPDDRIRSRDLIDLAVLRLSSPIPEVAIEKATIQCCPVCDRLWSDFKLSPVGGRSAMIPWRSGVGLAEPLAQRIDFQKSTLPVVTIKLSNSPLSLTRSLALSS